MRNTASPAFKDIKVGQVSKSRRCSSVPHNLSAAWAERRPWHILNRALVTHGRSGPQAAMWREGKAAAALGASMALPPLTHPMPSGRVTKGRLTFPTHRISTETLYQCGNHQLINNQTIWYRIRNFGDDHHVGDLPRETPITKRYTRGELVLCGSGNCSF